MIYQKQQQSIRDIKQIQNEKTNKNQVDERFYQIPQKEQSQENQFSSNFLPKDIVNFYNSFLKIVKNISQIQDNKRTIFHNLIDDFIKQIIQLTERIKDKVEFRVLEKNNNLLEEFQMFKNEIHLFDKQAQNQLKEVNKKYMRLICQLVKDEYNPIQSELDEVQLNKSFIKEKEIYLQRLESSFQKSRIKQIKEKLQQKNGENFYEEVIKEIKLKSVLEDCQKYVANKLDSLEFTPEQQFNQSPKIRESHKTTFLDLNLSKDRDMSYSLISLRDTQEKQNQNIYSQKSLGKTSLVTSKNLQKNAKILNFQKPTLPQLDKIADKYLNRKFNKSFERFSNYGIEQKQVDLKQKILRRHLSQEYSSKTENQQQKIEIINFDQLKLPFDINIKTVQQKNQLKGYSFKDFTYIKNCIYVIDDDQIFKLNLQLEIQGQKKLKFKLKSITSFFNDLLVAIQNVKNQIILIDSKNMEIKQIYNVKNPIKFIRISSKENFLCITTNSRLNLFFVNNNKIIKSYNMEQQGISDVCVINESDLIVATMNQEIKYLSFSKQTNKLTINSIIKLNAEIKFLRNNKEDKNQIFIIVKRKMKEFLYCMNIQTKKVQRKITSNQDIHNIIIIHRNSDMPHFLFFSLNGKIQNIFEDQSKDIIGFIGASSLQLIEANNQEIFIISLNQQSLNLSSLMYDINQLIIRDGSENYFLRLRCQISLTF